MQTHKYTYTHVYTHISVYTHIICVYLTVVSEKGAIREVEKELDEGKRKWKQMYALNKIIKMDVEIQLHQPQQLG